MSEFYDPNLLLNNLSQRIAMAGLEMVDKHDSEQEALIYEVTRKMLWVIHEYRTELT